MTANNFPPVALITGAAGALGRPLVRHLVGRGWQVRTLTREPGSMPSDGGIPFVGDLLHPGVAARAVDGADVVFHLAVRREGRGVDPDDVTRVNIEGTRLLARAARAAAVRRFVYFSSTSVYGDTRGEIADEQAPPAPPSLYARTKLAAESIALQEADGTVLRVAAVYGPNQTGNYVRLARMCRRGVYLLGTARRTLVYEGDLLDAALRAAAAPAATGQVFNITDGEVHSITAISYAMMSALEVHPRVPVPIRPLGFMASLAVARRAAWRPLFEDSAVDGRRAQRELGFAPAVRMDAGWRLTFDGWRDRGLL